MTVFISALLLLTTIFIRIGLSVPLGFFSFILILGFVVLMLQHLKKSQINLWTRTQFISKSIPPIALCFLSLLLGKRSGYFVELPQNYDALHHLTQISNITNFKSIDLNAIYGTTESVASSPTTAFYPHGIHFLAGAWGQLFHDPIYSFSVFYSMFSYIIYPLVIYSFTRSFTFSRPSSFAASATVISIGHVPLGPMSWGGLPQFAGIIALLVGIAWLNRNWPSILVSGELRRRRGSSVVAVRQLLQVLVVIGGCSAVHPTGGFVVLLFFLLKVVFFGARAVRLIGASLLALIVIFPFLNFLPGAGTLKELGMVDPSVSNKATEIGQMLFMSTNVDFKYGHLFALAISGAVLLPLTFKSEGATRLTSQGRFALASLFSVSMTVVAINLSILVSNTSFSWASFVSALWYRQYARTSYLLVVIVGLCSALLYEMSSSLWFGKRSKCRLMVTSRHRVLSAAIVLPMILATGFGFQTQKFHREMVQSIGPLSLEDYEAIKSFLNSEFVVGEAPFIIGDFNSGVSLLSAGLAAPSSGEPYGDQRAVGDLHSVLSAGYSLEEVNSFLMQWDLPLIFTNGGAPSASLSPEVVENSQYFEEVFEIGSSSLWRLRSYSVTLDGLLPPRSDLYGGQRVRGLADEKVTVRVESVKVPAEVDVAFEILVPPCALNGMKVVSPGYLDIEVKVLDRSDAVEVRLKGVVKERIQTLPLELFGTSCQIEGDTSSHSGFLTTVRYRS